MATKTKPVDLNSLSKEDLIANLKKIAQRNANLEQNQKALIKQNEQYQEALQTESKELIYKRMLDLKADLKAVGKNEKNEFAGWEFRGIDAMLNHFKPLMDKHRIGVAVNCRGVDKPEFITSDRGKTVKHGNVIMDYSFYTDDGSKIQMSIPAEAVATDDKGIAKALSQAFKYILIQGFCTPTEDIEEADRIVVDVSEGEKTKKDAKPKAAKKASVRKSFRNKKVVSGKSVVGESTTSEDDEL